MEEYTINDIPSTALASILRHLESHEDLASASCVNRAWRDTCNDSSVWENSYKAHIAKHHDTKSSFKQLAKERIAVDWRWERWFANPHWAPWADPGYGKHATFCFEDYVRSVHLRGDTVIASVGSVLVRDCSIHVTDTSTDTTIALNGYYSPLWSTDVSDDGALVASGNNDGEVMLWDLMQRTSMRLQLFTATPMNISIQAIALDEAHNALLVCVRNGEAMLCSLDRLRAQMNPVQEHTLDDNKYRWDHRPVAADAPPLAPHIQFLPASVALMHDGIACTAHKRQIKMFAHDNGTTLRPEGTETISDDVSALCMDVQGGLCVASSDDGVVHCFDLQRFGEDSRLGQFLLGKRTPQKSMAAPAVLLDGSMVVAAVSEGIMVAGARDGRPHMLMENTQGGDVISSVVKRGNTLVTGSWDGKVTAWDMRMRRQVKVLHEHNERVWALAANEQRLASGGLDGMVMVYNFS